LAVFQGANEDPYLTDTGRESNAEKQPTGSGPEGCDENGPTAALLVGYVSIETRSLLAPCRRPILIATKYLLFRGQDTSWVPHPVRARFIPKPLVIFAVFCAFAFCYPEPDANKSLSGVLLEVNQPLAAIVTTPRPVCAGDDVPFSGRLSASIIS